MLSVQVVHAQHIQPLKKKLITIRESRKESCVSLAPKLWFDGLCCGPSQVTFVLLTLICAKIANSLLSYTILIVNLVFHPFLPPCILPCCFSFSPSSEVWQCSPQTSAQVGLEIKILVCFPEAWQLCSNIAIAGELASEVGGAAPQLVWVSTGSLVFLKACRRAAADLLRAPLLAASSKAIIQIVSAA